MADEVIGLGTTLSGGTLGAVLTLRDVEGPADEADDIDVSSNVDMVAGTEFTSRFRKGRTNPGEITATAVFTDAGYAAAKAAQAARPGQDTYTITTETGSTLTTGDESYVKSVSPTFPWEGECVFDIVIKCSGKNTFTP